MGAAHSAGTATVGKVVAWSIAAVVGTVVVGAAVQGITGGGSGGDLDSARVVRVVDGDTIDVTRDGEEVRVRLLNIDTPETKDPDLPVQCLGPEATDFLEHLLPRGTRIELAYDEVVLDPYDRTLAAVFLDGELVNAQIAAEGLGLPVLFEPNDRFYNEVLVASESAERAQIGLFSSNIDCTIASQVDAAIAAADIDLSAVEGGEVDTIFAAATALNELEHLASKLSPEHVGDLLNTTFAAASASDYLSTKRNDLEDSSESLTGALFDAVRSRDDANDDLLVERWSVVEEVPPVETEDVTDTDSADVETVTPEENYGSGTEVEPAPEQEWVEPPVEESAPEPVSPPSDSSDSGGSTCVPYGPEIPYSNDGGYTGKRYGMPGGETFRMCD